jgi:hypothetical protein
MIDHDNIAAAFERRDRITEVKFRNLTSFPVHLKGLSTFLQEPLPSLTGLDLKGKDIVTLPPTPMLVLPETLLGGSAPRLLSFFLENIAFPALPTFLMSACHGQLTTLILKDVPGFSPEEMAACLATQPNLKMFFSAPKNSSMYLPNSTTPPPLIRVDLLNLTHFDFYGDIRYLEELVARMNAPFLHQLCVDFTVDTTFSVSRFYQFIARSERLKESQVATMNLNPWLFSISNRSENLLQVGSETLFFLQTYSPMLNGHIGSMARICNDISPLLSQVNSLRIQEDHVLRRNRKTTWSPRSG